MARDQTSTVELPDIADPGGLASPGTPASRDRDIARLATGAGVSLIGKLVGRGIHVLGQVILARLLGPAAFGIYAIGWTLVHILGLIAPLGLDVGVVRYAPRYWRTSPPHLRGVILQSLGWSTFSSFLTGAALFLAAPWLADGVFQEPELTAVIRLFSLALPTMTGLRVAAAATRVTQRMKYSVYAMELCQPIVHLLLVVACGVAGLGLLGGVAAAVVSFGAAFTLALYYLKRLFPEAFTPGLQAPPVARKLLTFSLPTSFAGMTVMLSLWVDRLLVGYFRPAAEVGIYQACSQSAMVFAIILAGFNTILSPLIVDLFQQRQKARLQELYRVSTRWGLYISLVIFLVIAIAARQILSLVFGSEYAAGGSALILLAFGQLTVAATGATGMLMVMTGHQNRWFALSGCTLMLNIVLNVVLVPGWGITGAALATATALSALSLGGILQVRNRLHLWPYDRTYLKGLLATAFAILAVLALHGSGNGSPFLSALLATLVFTASLVFAGLEGEDRQIVALVRERLGLSGGH